METDSTRSARDTPRFTTAARALLDGIDAQAETVDRVAGLCADAIAAGGLVHLFGTGHSRIPVEEMFPRYGSYPGFNPIVELSMTFHTQVILANYELRPTDMMIVFSASGLSTVPIEMALGAKERGLTVVAVTSVAQSQAGEPSHAAGRLLDVADVVLDLGTPPADALIEIEGLETPVAPGSTLAAVALVNEIKAQTARRLVERGAMPPVITSAAVVGRDESARLFDEAYAEHARRYARALRGVASD
jgi:uncharacterized phosphosugar-binding protein